MQLTPVGYSQLNQATTVNVGSNEGLQQQLQLQQQQHHVQQIQQPQQQIVLAGG